MPIGTSPAVTVWASLDLPGFHHWPATRGRGKRAYLAHRHRHLFGIRVEVAVDHDDRHVEFHDLSDEVRAWWGPQPREWGTASCEAIARQLATGLTDRGLRVTAVEVSEDREHGATVRYPLTEDT